MTVDIVQINKGNTELLLRIDADVFDEKIDFERLEDLVNESNHIILVAVSNGVVIGQARAIIHCQPDGANELYIDNLGVSPALQRRGIATRLIQRLVLLGGSFECEEVWLATEPDNEEAIGFYKSLGLSVRQALVFEGSLRKMGKGKRD